LGDGADGGAIGAFFPAILGPQVEFKRGAAHDAPGGQSEQIAGGGGIGELGLPANLRLALGQGEIGPLAGEGGQRVIGVPRHRHHIGGAGKGAGRDALDEGLAIIQPAVAEEAAIRIERDDTHHDPDIAIGFFRLGEGARLDAAGDHAPLARGRGGAAMLAGRHAWRHRDI
jgi:hypothetical protein